MRARARLPVAGRCAVPEHREPGPGPPDPPVGRTRTAMGRRSVTGDVGTATVEIAVALPALVLLTVLLLWGLTAAHARLACADAARAGARAAARGEPSEAVRAAVAAAVPAGARITVRRDATTTKVEVVARVPAPAMARMPPLTVRASAVAATEPGVDVRPGVGRRPATDAGEDRGPSAGMSRDRKGGDG